MSIPVTDPFGVTDDPVLDHLPAAIDPDAVQAILDRGVPELAPAGAIVLEAVRVVRYKPRRRCLVEYDLTVTGPDATTAVTVIGKVRRHRPGHHQHRLLRALWDAGFDERAADAICVPRPMGELRELSMWLQHRVPGVPATRLLAGPEGAALASRLAEAAHKIHQARVPTRKTHWIEDELGILDGCLETVATAHPALAPSIRRLAGDCRRAARSTAALPATGIHRDFYADQVVVDGTRLTVVDFDLYTTGDPALDIGNLVGHIAEQALRELGDPAALDGISAGIVERFAEVAGEATRRPVRLYAALTVARHVFLAHERPERRHLVPALIDLARDTLERQLAAARTA